MRRESDPQALRVLLVEDDEDDYLLTRECLFELGSRRVELEWVSTYERALEELGSGAHDICLLDYQLGATTGLELLRRARGTGWRGPFILLTGQADDAVDHEAERAGVADYLEKSQLTGTLLHRSIRYALQHTRTLEQLRRSQASFRDLIEHLPDGVCVVQDGAIVYINSTYARMLGRPVQELVGRDLLDVNDGMITQADLARLVEDIAYTERTGRIASPRELTLHLKNGTLMTAEAGHVPLLFEGRPSRVWTLRDLTERKQLEARLLRADRMGALGLLAAGVAHEINNPLAYMMANLDLLERQVLPRLAPSDTSTEAHQLLDEARMGATRVRDIVRQLKMFSRAEEDAALGPVDVHQVLERSIGMTVHELKHRARVVRDFCSASVRAEANEGRLNQVILNLLVNAAQAITEGHAEDNEVRIATRLEGEFVRIEVRDTGSGIAPENLQRVFEPFFTTKPVGVGTGLGLSICHDLVTGFGGRMGVESQPGRGSTFWLLLKRSEAPRAPEPPAPVPARPEPRRGRILVVDDEPLIGTAIRRMLQREHEVVTLTSAREALTRLLGGERFDVIFCDVMMPEMSGVEFHQQLQLHLPQRAARLVFLTGGAFTPQTQEVLGKVHNRRLDKPFSGQELHDAVQALLATPAAP